jgi:hypothetical protein
MRRKPVDLSYIYCDGDLGRAQRNHGELPPELIRHMCAAFAHKAGLAPSPGFYSGPAPEPPPEEE